jgi:magnesium transporter
MLQGAPVPTDLFERLDGMLGEADGERRRAALGEFLLSVRPEDIAAVLPRFSPDQKVEIFRALPPETAAVVMDEADWGTTREIVSELSTPDLGRIVEEMPPDEATDLVGDLTEEERRELFAELEPETIGEVSRLLRHHPESAGGIMTSESITVGPDLTAEAVLDLLQERLDTEVVAYVYVVDEGERLIGVFSIRDLLRAAPEARVRDFMKTELISARTDDDQEKVALLARKYNLKSIPIVDEEGRLVGLATIDDILDILAEEADEDIYRMAGVTDSNPTQQRMLRRVLVRLPWLLLPVISGFVIASLHGDGGDDGEPSRFGDQFTLVAFIPMVMGIAGAVGTQTATVMVRGMATGDIEAGRRRRVFLQEVGIGILIALVMSSLVGAAIALAHGAGILPVSTSLAPAIGLGLAGGIVLASIFGTLFPICCEAIGLDPALVAGPFITSSNDVLGATTFLAIAELVLHR